ncbi:MAG: chloride channel protein, partial [Synechococcaceae cyanobacterium]|nr:chloride channel protein [Synechococcaceae cyanobacterium]
MIAALACWLLLGVLIGALEWPYQLLSELGFRLQRGLWSLAPLRPDSAAAVRGLPITGCLLVFAASLALILLAWGPLAGGRGGGLTPVLALQEDGGEGEDTALLGRLDLRSQLRRLPLLLLTHLGGLAVGVESPSAALGASLLLAI